MTVTSLTVVIGLFCLLVAVVASALFRTATASLLSKITIMVALAALPCFLWYTIPTILGYPLATDFASLPETAELVAFVPHDNEKRVDLWLREGSKDPRAYSIPMTDDLKGTLEKAKKELADGPVAVGKRTEHGKKRPHQFSDIDGGNAPYELLDNAFNLPKKD